MKMDRRSFVAGGALALSGCWGTAACAAQYQILRPEDFGARGDGVTDDTRALQACLSRAPEGATVRLRTGAVYRVDTNLEPTWESFGGLKLKARQTLDMNGAELRALPSSARHGAVIQAYRAHGWRIEGPGRITGERDVHTGETGEWGMGVAVFSSSGWIIRPGVEINNCWGDGLYVGGHGEGRFFCEDFVIDQVHIWNCRRNGISVIAGRNGDIRSPHIHRIGGIAPEGAIDLEPDDWRMPNRNVRIRNGRIYDAQVGIYVVVSNEDILISGMDIEAANSGVIVSDHSVNVSIVDNPSIKSTVGGAEGGAIRTVTTNPAAVKHLHILRNGLFGGGDFVVDIFGLGYVDLIVANNRIHASNRGTQGIARIGGGRFTDNIGVIERNAGKPGEFFVLFEGGTHGRTVYRNLSPHRMYAVVRHGATYVGGDTFEGPRLF